MVNDVKLSHISMCNLEPTDIIMNEELAEAVVKGGDARKTRKFNSPVAMRSVLLILLSQGHIDGIKSGVKYPRTLVVKHRKGFKAKASLYVRHIYSLDYKEGVVTFRNEKDRDRVITDNATGDIFTYALRLNEKGKLEKLEGNPNGRGSRLDDVIRLAESDPLNRGFSVADPTRKVASGCNQLSTPVEYVKRVIKYIPEGAVVWCPFDTSTSNYVKEISKTHKVIHSHIDDGQDFYMYEPEEHWDIMVSTPTFSNKKSVFTRAMSFNKPFILATDLPWLKTKIPGDLAKKFGVDQLYPLEESMTPYIHDETGTVLNTSFATVFLTNKEVSNETI